jgi:pyruvate,water dikinase
MSGLVRFFTGFLKGKGKPEVEESPEVLRSMFKVRYLSFKTLLHANNNALEIISDMEHALHRGHGFGMAFIRANCTAVSVNVYKIVQNMNDLAPNGYEALFDVFEGIRDKVNNVLDEHRKFGVGELALSLEEVNKESADQVGGKMANLGEIRNQIGLPVPEGFVVTASAYQRFLEHNGLQDEINRRVQSLDLEDLEMLHTASADIQQLIIRAELPPELEEAILSRYRHLEEETKTDINVSLRSSALGEDTERSSFAGQYRSELNVHREFLTHTYKEIVASKYTPQAISYRLNMGFKDEDIAMAVGCMAMVDAVSSGVMYSRDPGDIRNSAVFINAVWGLAKTVVDGTVSPDLFVISREQPGEILKKEISIKEEKFVCFAEEGVCRMAAVEEDKDHAAITDDQAVALAELAIRLEDYYGSPQDIEWSIGKDGVARILQSRPLRQLDVERGGARGDGDFRADAPVVLEGGVTASPGVASGPAFVVNSTVDALQFPAGAVLVARHSLPQWAAVLSRASAVITDRGGIAGHLATVSREFNLPALFDTAEATKRIESGMILTVDADGLRVYEGKVASLLETTSTERVNLMKGSPVYNTLERVLGHISPLNLTDPEGDNFTPQGCKTYHDITRYCHEKSVKEMFTFGKKHHFPERSSKQLVCDIPVRYWVIDLEDGFKEPVEGDKVNLDNIASVPMLALWKGITAIPWKGPPPVDAKGFAAIMFRSTMDPSLDPGRQSRYAEKNYFMISRNFCNLVSRFGYHFSTVEAYLSEKPKENYASFSFKGGAADLERRIRRIKFIEHILEQFDFRIEINEDWMVARLDGYDQDFLIERLKVLGYVTMHTRQLDMIMANQAKVNYYIEQHLKDIRSFVSI